MIQSVWKNLTGLQLNTSGVTLNEPQTHHQWLVHSLYGQKYWHPFFRREKALPNCANKDGNIINVLKHCFPPLLHQFWSVWNDCLHMYKSLVFVDEFVAHLKSHQRCSAAFCRPVKFFHTDWIIISLWFLSYTQRHCHVRIEKSPNCWYTIRFLTISLYA